MAMTKCKECGNDVSTEAKTCPHCGVDNPGLTTEVEKKAEKKESMSSMIGSALFLGMIVFGVSKCSSEDSPEEKAKQEVAAAECRQDLQCWGDKSSFSAGVYCTDPIERLAKNSHKWTDGTLETKFSRFKWKDKKAGTVTHIGDRIQFQNGFGAWVNHVYECDFDPATDTVLAVRAKEGQL